MSDRVAEMRALAHPSRLQILSMLTAEAMSASDIARGLGMSQANASYHVRQLARAGLIELVEEAVVRGGRVKRYRYVDDQPGEAARRALHDSAEVAAVYDTLSAELQRRARQRLASDVSESLSTDAELWIDGGTWRDVVAQISAATRLLHERAVSPGTEGAIRTSTTVALFEMTDEQPRGQRRERPQR